MDVFRVRASATLDEDAAEVGLDLQLRDRLGVSIDWSGQISNDTNANANALIARASRRF